MCSANSERLTDLCSPGPNPALTRTDMSSTSRYEAVERVDVLRAVDYGQLTERKVAVVGCGALGGAVAMHLVRSGVGTVRVIDRDVVELRNLTHQILYNDEDAILRRLKAEAAATHLAGLNRDCTVEGVTADLAPDSALRLTLDADLIIDGADNLETKFLLNDVAVATNTPLVYAGCAGTEGSVMAIVPAATHCLRCLWPTPSAAAARLTCETRGVLPGTVAMIAALQFTEALKILLGFDTDSLGALIRADVWHNALHPVPLPTFSTDGRACPTCVDRDFTFLRGDHHTATRELCGGETVLLSPPTAAIDLARLARRHHTNASLRVQPECLQVEVDGCRFLVFSSGRTLIHGAGGVNRARALYARHIIG